MRSEEGILGIEHTRKLTFTLHPSPLVLLQTMACFLKPGVNNTQVLILPLFICCQDQTCQEKKKNKSFQKNLHWRYFLGKTELK